MRLFESKYLTEAVFETEAFKYLFENTINMYSLNGWSVLMVICEENRNLLDKNLWFLPKLFELTFKCDNNKNTALNMY